MCVHDLIYIYIRVAELSLQLFKFEPSTILSIIG